VADSPSAHTADQVLELLQRQLDDMRLQLDERYHTQIDALALALADMGHRLDAVNEFRAQLGDLIARLATRAEVDLQIKALSERIDQLSTLIGALSQQFSTGQGVITGQHTERSTTRSDDSLLTARAAALLAALSLVAAIILAIVK